MSLSPPMTPYNSADPSASFLSSSSLDFLLIELVPLAHRIAFERDSAALSSASASASGAAAVAAAASSGDAVSTTTGGRLPASGSSNTLTAPGPGTGKADSTTASHAGTVLVAGSTASATRRLDDEEHLDAVHFRLESQGYRVGQGLVERFSKDRPRFNDTLDVIKFLCKDLWSLVFGKNIDNLKTNHRGVYVLTDNVFRPFSRMSTETGSQAVLQAQPFLWFPCGIVRGALAALGINATVQAEINELPGAVFQIKTLPVKS